MKLETLVNYLLDSVNKTSSISLYILHYEIKCINEE